MKRIIISLWVLSAAGLGGISTAPAQGLPKTQPKLLTIVREEVKIGRDEEHSKHEAGSYSLSGCIACPQLRVWASEKSRLAGDTQPHCSKVPNWKYTASMSECHRGYRCW